jgi:aminomethyltransferase
MKTTPLFPIYQAYGAKVIDFHGWALPVQFQSIIQEHLTVRNQVGLFDVSHMGEILVDGPDAASFIDRMVTNRTDNLRPGSIRYSPLCDEQGGAVDDLLIYCLREDRFWLVVNASNIDKDFDWLRAHAGGYRLQLENQSDQTAQLAVQGPLARPLMEKLLGAPLSGLKYYQFRDEVRLQAIPVLLSRTGYTGEDGFELYCRPEYAIAVWEMLISEGREFGIQPIGLGARDTLRFEAGLPLYGQELSAEISPLEAGLERFVKFEKPDFIGKAALERMRRSGIKQRLAGLEMIDRGIPRSDCPVRCGDQVIGRVTSGTYCPSLEKNLAIGLVPADLDPETPVQIEIRGKALSARFVPLPFYSRQKGAN